MSLIFYTYWFRNLVVKSAFFLTVIEREWIEKDRLYDLRLSIPVSRFSGCSSKSNALVRAMCRRGVVIREPTSMPSSFDDYAFGFQRPSTEAMDAAVAAASSVPGASATGGGDGSTDHAHGLHQSTPSFSFPSQENLVAAAQLGSGSSSGDLIRMQRSVHSEAAGTGSPGGGAPGFLTFGNQLSMAAPPSESDPFQLTVSGGGRRTAVVTVTAGQPPASRAAPDAAASSAAAAAAKPAARTSAASPVHPLLKNAASPPHLSADVNVGPSSSGPQHPAMTSAACGTADASSQVAALDAKLDDLLLSFRRESTQPRPSRQASPGTNRPDGASNDEVLALGSAAGIDVQYASHDGSAVNNSGSPASTMFANTLPPLQNNFRLEYSDQWPPVPTSTTPATPGAASSTPPSSGGRRPQPAAEASPVSSGTAADSAAPSATGTSSASSPAAEAAVTSAGAVAAVAVDDEDFLGPVTSLHGRLPARIAVTAAVTRPHAAARSGSTTTSLPPHSSDRSSTIATATAARAAPAAAAPAALVHGADAGTSDDDPYGMFSIRMNQVAGGEGGSSSNRSSPSPVHPAMGGRQ